jgi:hypothetical protein
MPVALKLRDDCSAEELRALARRSKDVNQSRRLLSFAAVRDGMDRRAAARIGGMDRQILLRRRSDRYFAPRSRAGNRNVLPSIRWCSRRSPSRTVGRQGRNSPPPARPRPRCKGAKGTPCLSATHLAI